MSVAEYEVKFSELAHFVPTVMESESMKCLKFQEGLKNVIRRSIFSLRLCSYNDHVAATTCVEQDNLAYHRSREEAKASGGPLCNNKKG